MIKTDGPTGILMFDLADPSQIRDHKRCVDSEKIVLRLWDIHNILFTDKSPTKKLKEISEILGDIPFNDYIE